LALRPRNLKTGWLENGSGQPTFCRLTGCGGYAAAFLDRGTPPAPACTFGGVDLNVQGHDEPILTSGQARKPLERGTAMARVQPNGQPG
jgi:hypothetical protein